MSAPLDDEPTRPRRDSFAIAQTELVVGEILHAVGQYLTSVPEELEGAIRQVLGRFSMRRERQSQTAMRVATEAEVEAANERVRRQALERETDRLRDQLAAARMRETALAKELEELRRDISR